MDVEPTDPANKVRESESAFLKTGQESSSGEPRRSISDFTGQVGRWIKSKPLLAMGSVLAVIAVVVAVSALGGMTNKQTLRGTVSLTDHDGNIAGTWNTCEGTGGYDDVSPGARLSIRGRNGEIVGSGTVQNLDDAAIEQIALAEGAGDGGAAELRTNLASTAEFLCVLYFEAEVEETDYYAIEFSHRGELQYSKEELKEKDWYVGFTLGD